MIFVQIYNMMGKNHTNILLVVSFHLLLAGLVGRGLVNQFPFEMLLWYEDVMRPLVEFFGYDWTSFSVHVGRYFELISNIWVAIIISLSVLFWLFKMLGEKTERFIQWGYRVGIGFLFVLGFVMWFEAHFKIANLLEMAILMGLPAIILWKNSTRKINFLTVFSALVFIGHGMYAAGIYPVPGHFIDMCIHFFGMDETTARLFLKIMGVLDFIVAVLIFFPSKWRLIGLWYMVVWGLATAFARYFSNMHIDFYTQWLPRWWFEVVIRLPHGLVPLAILAWGMRSAKGR